MKSRKLKMKLETKTSKKSWAKKTNEIKVENIRFAKKLGCLQGSAMS